MTRKPSLLSVVTLGAATALALTASEPAAHAQRVSFTYSGHHLVRYYTVPETGLYKIIAFGAQGGNGRSGPGGRGSKISGNFSLAAGEILQIAIGRAGGDGDGGGGGGGSFVVALDGTPLGTPLVIAGGGGGGGFVIDPSITVPGQGGGLQGPDGSPLFGGSSYGVGGTGGNGGCGGTPGGGGGGGFRSPGSGCGSPFGGSGGGGAFPGLAGGSPLGGFGGGGGGGSGAGGGGGYSGGGGSTVHSPGWGGGGGGSFSADPDQIPVADLQTGDGEVVIMQISPVFAGTPGKANCHGHSVSALAKDYTGLNNAAAALGFDSVDALQNAIMAFCEA